MTTDTEKICEVVRITEVLPHPNADRLELAHFELKTGPTAYTCVISKGQFKPGDLAGYVGVDCIVPLEGPLGKRWAFLLGRLDGAGKTEFRVKAARIRMVYSEGILTEVAQDGPHQLGDPLAELWGIRFYERPIKGGNVEAGPKSNAKDPTLGGLFPIYGVDSLKKAPWLFDPHEMVVLREKIHGCNMRVGWLPVGFMGRPKFVVGSHRTVKTDMRGPFTRLWDRIRGRKRSEGWYGTDIWTKAAEKYDLARKLKGSPDLVCYFELYGKTPNGAEIQPLTYGGVELGLRFIDAYDADTGKWLTETEKMAVSAGLGIARPIPVYVGPWGDLESHRPRAEGTSKEADHVIEGWVAHSVDGTKRGKLKGEGFLLAGHS